MSVPVEIEIEIRRLYFAEHWRVGTIAAQLGVHEDVVKRVTGLAERKPSAAPRPLLIAPVADFITETLERYPRLRATRLYDMVRDRGYQGSIRTLRKYVATVRPKRKAKAYLRTESLIGEQAQVDWAHAGKLRVAGGERAVWLFVIVLSWSRAMWAEFVFEQTADSLRRSLIRALSFFGGSPRQWLFDNAKAVVTERRGEAVRFHPQLLELAGVYCAQPRVCEPRQAHQKGKVERAIRYLRERFLAARTIHSIAYGNAQLGEFIHDIAHARPHPVQRMHSVQHCLELERERLLPLPDNIPSTERLVLASAGKDSFAHFDGNQYSVPPDLAQQVVTLGVDDRVIRVLDGENARGTHARCWGKGQIFELEEHRAQLMAERTEATTTKGRDRLSAAAPGISELFERWVGAGRNVGSLTARTLKLLDLYGEEIFAESVSRLLATDVHDIGALAVLCEQRRRDNSEPIPVDVQLGDHVPDRDVIPHDLENYDV